MSAQMTLVRYSAGSAGRVGVAVAAHVRRDRAEAGGGERRELVAPGVPELGPAVAQDHGEARAGLRDVHANAVRLDRSWRMAGGMGTAGQLSPARSSRNAGRAARVGRALARQPQDGREEGGEEQVQHARGKERGAADPVDDEPHARGGVGELPSPPARRMGVRPLRWRAATM